MDENFKYAIDGIFKEFGKDILLDGRRFCAIVADYAPKMTTERHVVQRLNQEELLPEIYKELVSPERSDGTSLRLEVLLDDSGFSKEWKVIVLKAFGFKYKEEEIKDSPKEESAPKRKRTRTTKQTKKELKDTVTELLDCDDATADKIRDNDEQISLFCKSDDITASYCNRIKDICNNQKWQLSECKKNNVKTPSVKNSSKKIADVLNRIELYKEMIQLDEGITQFMDTDPEKLSTYCYAQTSNIAICHENNYQLPQLVNANLDEIRKKLVKKENNKKFLRGLIKTGIVIATVLIVCFGVKMLSRRGKIQLPVNVKKCIGNDYKGIYQKLQKAGFENISLVSSDEGTLADNEILEVNIDGKESFLSKGYYKPGTPITIKYSSPNRFDISDELTDWNDKKVDEVKDLLENIGLENVSIRELDTNDKNNDRIIAHIETNGENYIDGSCYVFSGAPIVIEYYLYKIEISKIMTEYVGRDYSEVEQELRNAGFTNINLRGERQGYFKEKTVKRIITGEDNIFDINLRYIPETEITIIYSAETRKDITAYISSWNEKTPEELEGWLRSNGFSYVDLNPVETLSSSQDNKIVKIEFTGEEYTGGDCYVQSNANIVVSYYSVKKITMPKKASKYTERNYKKVTEELKELGFTNISYKQTDDLVTGLVDKENEVKSIKIDGISDFSADTVFNCDAPVVIKVNTYKRKSYPDLE